MSFRHGFAAALLLASTALPTWAADYYVAPLGAPAVSNPDGSRERPFPSADAALKSGKVMGGDRVLLMDGFHGRLELGAYKFAEPVTFMSENARNAHVERIAITGAGQNLTFMNFSVWPKDPYAFKGIRLIETISSSSRIVFKGLDVRAGEDAYDYPNWTKEEWLARRVPAAQLNGSHSTLANSTFVGVGTGIATTGTGASVIENRILGFSADGMRGIGSASKFSGNYVTDCVQVDSNHADGFQSWATNGSVTGLEISANSIFEWSNPVQSPLRCSLQGIGLFDGFFDDLKITNNVVVVTAPHGISVYGGRGVEIINNTVVEANGALKNYPWIGVFNHKDGTPSSNVSVVNNLAMSLGGTSYAGAYRDSNKVILDPALVFDGFPSMDFRPNASSGFLDVANTSYAPVTDVLGNPRPAGGGPDLGAYEVGAGSTEIVTVTAPIFTDTPTVSSGTGTTTDTTNTTTDPVPTTDTGTTDTSAGTDTTTTTEPAPTTEPTTTTKPGRSAGKWSKPTRK